MKKQNLKIIACALAGLASAPAFAGCNRLAVQELVSSGMLMPLPEDGAFEVNRPLLGEMLAAEASLEARHTMNLLQQVAGAETDVTQVQIIDARYAQQDIMCSQ